MPIRSNFDRRPNFLTCSLCNEFVELETTKLDEFGKPVHEECYAQKVSRGRTPRPPPRDREDVSKKLDHPLPRTIVDFLSSASARSAPKLCTVHESALEFRDCTFFYMGQTWEIRLPVCVKCRPS
jgi:hypothetical protein